MTEPAGRSRIDDLLMAVVAMGLFSAAASVVHEGGHIAVCAAGGYDWTVEFDSLGFVVDCSGLPEPLWVYWAMGGVAGAAFLVSLAVDGRLRRSIPWRAGLIAAVCLQLVIMVSETTTHQTYMTSYLPTVGAGVFSLAILLLLVLYSHRLWED